MIDLPQQYQSDFIEQLVEQLDIYGLTEFEHIIAEEIRAKILERTGLTASAGV